ncbi:hypothetical protein [Roseicyclus mahoneyensis]|uniref:Uncharacterized protein n=1 Tax=Roseicyclus mahoneyensis TaxID=164332 RepID=A0A316GP07_9RHOB|nr:hypothetical protein [Roseicyclus mahoneyensis]PWK61680.1 hypothetical protein C7455_102372 [Roseicyclus mahoneyensis]
MRALFLCFALLAAGPAAALSCMRPEIATSFAMAAESPDDFVLAVGRLVRSGPDRTEGVPGPNPGERGSYSFAARFEGNLASPRGFDIPRSFDVTVEVECFSVWCGSPSLGENGLYFFRRDGADDHALIAGLCGGFHFGNPTPAQLRQILSLAR